MLNLESATGVQLEVASLERRLALPSCTLSAQAVYNNTGLTHVEDDAFVVAIDEKAGALGFSIDTVMAGPDGSPWGWTVRIYY